MIIVGYEMRWTVQYFMFKMKAWYERKKNALMEQQYGAAVYASCQSATWGEMAHNTNNSFAVDKSYICRCKPTNMLPGKQQVCHAQCQQYQVY